MRHPTAARRAFTMVEMLVTISIIILLVALGILAYAHIDRATVMRATRADLQMAQGFLDEYNAGPGISQLGSGADTLNQSFPYKGGVFPAATPPGAGPNNTGPIGGTKKDSQTAVWTGNVSLAGDQRLPVSGTTGQGSQTSFPWDTSYTSGSAGHNAIYNTAEVMVLLMRLPAVNQSIGKLQSSKLLTLPGGSLSLSNGTLSMPAPILLDGWGNPIIFVPAGGLVTKVSGGASGTQHVLVRSSGIIDLDNNPNGYTAANPPPLKDNDHPFWASAGPDGDFYGADSTNGGDDNIYSFQQ